MYRGRLWTMRQFAGYGTPAETNARYRFLTEHGQTGLSVAFDMPTLMGLDSDDPRSEGEVGRCGVATDSLDDFETLFDKIPLGDVTTSMTISGPAVVVFAFFLATAEEQGVDWTTLDGTLQTDIFKEYIAQKEWVFPPRPHLRLIGDLMEFCAEHVPKWHPISVSGYHIREAGATAARGARVHARRRIRLRRARHAARPRRRRLLARALVLLQRTHRLLRGDREAPRRAPDLGSLDARPLWCEVAGGDAPAIPHADGRRVPHGPAADEQRGPHGDRGSGRGPGRHAVAAHERAGRGPRASHRGHREARPPYPTGDRVRVGCPRRHRSAGGLVVRRGGHRPDRSSRRGDLRGDRADGERLDARGCPRGDRAGLVPAADRRVGVPGAAALRVRRPREGGRHATSSTRTRPRSTRS